MLTLHIQFTSHLVTVISKKIIIKRLIITSNTSSYTCCMCGKDSSYLRQMLINIKHTESGHPFISMIDNLLTLSYNMFIETFYH